MAESESPAVTVYCLLAALPDELAEGAGKAGLMLMSALRSAYCGSIFLTSFQS